MSASGRSVRTGVFALIYLVFFFVIVFRVLWVSIAGCVSWWCLIFRSVIFMWGRRSLLVSRWFFSLFLFWSFCLSFFVRRFFVRIIFVIILRWCRISLRSRCLIRVTVFRFGICGAAGMVVTFIRRWGFRRCLCVLWFIFRVFRAILGVIWIRSWTGWGVSIRRWLRFILSYYVFW